MKKFELWLDESGSFEDDTLSNKKAPSLVGGILWQTGQFGEDKANRILGKRTPREKVHFVEEKDSQRAVDVLIASKKAGIQFVVFQNEERLKIVDNDTTYLNVLAEGIVQLLRELLAKYREFRLSIAIATRKNMIKGSGIISAEEYVRRLKEKITLLYAKKSLHTVRNGKWSYTIEFHDAREDGRLQIADCVCNTFLTQGGTRKFSLEQRQTIQKLFKDTYKYSVLGKELTAEYMGLIGNENYGEAIFSLYCETDEEILKQRTDLANLIIRKMTDLHINVIKNNFNQVMAHVDTLIEYDKQFILTEGALKNIQDSFIPAMKETGIDVPEFSFNISLYLYVIYTHRGSKAGYEQDDICVRELQRIEDLFMRLECFYKYSNRRSIHLKNMFDFHGSLQAIDTVIHIADQMKEALQLVHKIETVLPEEGAIKNDELAKAYGTRLQIWPLLWTLNRKDEYIQRAEQDYQQALDNFTSEQDKERQFLYLSIMKTITGDFVKALALVLRSADISYEKESDIDRFLQALKLERFQAVEYKFLAYFRLMAYAKAKEDPLGDLLYEKLKKNSISVSTFQSQHEDYPVNMIYWFYAEYLKNGQLKEAIKYYDKALDMKRDSADFTMKFITLGILAAKILAKPQTVTDLEKEFCERAADALKDVGEAGQLYWQCISDKKLSEVVQKALLIG